MKVRRPRRNPMEPETTRPPAIAAEFRHHDPFCPFDVELISDATLARLRTA